MADKRSFTQPPLQYPWLLLTKTGQNDGYLCSTSPLYSSYSTSLFYPDLHIKQLFNCCYGWIILLNYDGIFFLWNPVKSRLLQLPPLGFNDQDIGYAVLSSPGKEPNDDLDPNCMIMLFRYCIAKKRACITYLLLGDKEWISVPYGGEFDELRNPIIFDDAVYALRGFQLVSINHVHPTGVSTTSYDSLPEISRCKVPLKHLVESCGELFYIVVHWNNFSADDISTIEAFNFDLVSKTWIKVTEVGDRVFLFNVNYCVSSSAAKGEMKGGNMSYISLRQSCVYSYSFEHNTISTYFLPKLFNLPNLGQKYSSIPYLPDTRLIDGAAVQMNLVKSKIKEVKVLEEMNGGESLLYCFPNDLVKFITRRLNPVDYLCFRFASRFGGLFKAVKSKITGDHEETNELGEYLSYGFPDELITLITRSLNPIEYLNFRSTSRACRLYARQIGSFAHAPPPSPWLMLTDNRSKIFSFVDSELGGQYFKNIPKSLVDTRIMSSNNGWLLITKCSEEFSLYNPFTARVIELPRPPLRIDRTTNICLSSSPTSSKCIVVSMFQSKIQFLEVGSKNWQTYSFDDFYLDNRSPIFHNGSFWFLGARGTSLGAFSVEDDGRVSWKVLFLGEGYQMLSRFLVSCAGNLLLVTVGKVGEPIEVFVLNETTSSWGKVSDLGDHALYLCRSPSFSTRTRAKWMRSVIFFPRVLYKDRVLHKDRIVFYSMDTKKYHTLANKDEPVEFLDTAELLLSDWIQPSWS